MKALSLCILTLALAAPQALAAGAEQASEKPGLAVFDLSAGYGAEPKLAQFLNEIMLTALRRTGRFSTIIAGSDIQQMLDMDQRKTALGCDETSCLAELGGALGVPYLASGQLGKLGASYRITVKLIAVEDGTVLAREMGKAKDEEEAAELLQALVVNAAAAVPDQVSEPVAARPVAAEKPAETAPKSVKRSSMRRPLGAGFLTAAIGLVSWRYWQHQEAQEAFDSSPSTASADHLVDAADAGKIGLGVSGGLAILGLYLLQGASP